MNSVASGLLAVARDYALRGWAVIPVPHASKNPGRSGWQRLRLSVGELAEHFNGAPGNIGVLLGEPSQWLVDVDVDHARGVARADEFLPATAAVFGRSGKPRSHRLYRVTAPVASKKFQSRSAGMLVELRSTGLQTVFPPSTHPSGEAITWDGAAGEPALVSPDDLLAAVTALANAVRVELGERVPPRSAPARRADPRVPGGAPHVLPHAAGDATSTPAPRAGAVAAMLRIRRADLNDGSLRLFMAACRAVEYGLSDAEALRAIRQYEALQPFPAVWTDGEIIRRLRDAEARVARGAAVEPDEQGLTRLGYPDPLTGRLVLSPKRTLPTAQAYLRAFHDHPDGVTLRSQSGQFLAWRDNRYALVEESEPAAELLPWLHEAARYVVHPRTQARELVPFDANPTTTQAALESLHAVAHVPAAVSAPAWLDSRAARFDPAEIVACRSFLLHLPTMTKLAPTPAFFNVAALDFDHDPAAPPPVHWLAFLQQLFGADAQAHALLQEWFGYCLTGDTAQQKMLLIVGPKRSGKGTIARVLRQLVGPGHVCGPTTSSLAGPFGLQPLLGKAVAVVSDARFAGDGILTVVERLLCISGEDALTIDRKFLTSVTLKLPTRFVFLTNELPRLTDASGALAGRFMLLRLTESFYGREDHGLTMRLLSELPGILTWAIAGWQRLRERGRFEQPASVEPLLRDLEDLASPVGAFVRERCEVGAGRRVSVDALYRAWQQWCAADGRASATTKQRFGRDLLAAAPGVTNRVSTGNLRFYQGIGLKRGLP